MDAETFSNLGCHLITNRDSEEKYDDLLSSIPLLRALWDAPILSAHGHAPNFYKQSMMLTMIY